MLVQSGISTQYDANQLCKKYLLARANFLFYRVGYRYFLYTEQS